MIINYLFYLQIKPCVVDGWMDGWVDGRESGVKDCLQQSKILNFGYFKKLLMLQLNKV